MSAGTPSTTDDGSRVSAHFWHPSLKTSTSAHFEAALAIDNNLDKKGKDTALAYLQALTSSRSIFISKLDSSAANTDAELDTAASAYLSLLLGTVNDYAPASNPAELDHETDSRLQALLGSGPRRVNTSDELAVVSQQMQGNAPTRHAVQFQWQDVLQTQGPSSTFDTVYEMASVLVSVAVWKQRRAVYLCQGSKPGTNSEAAIKAYSLLRCAGGLYQFSKDKCTPLLANICHSLDCNAQVLQGHMQLALADAQSITVLRAIQKGNAPSLVASLAHDTANMYQAAAQAFQQVASSSGMGSKAGKYAEWKLLVFQGYMFAFTGLGYLSSHEGGKAVKCAGESTSLCQAAAKAAAVFDKSAPASLAGDHQYFDAAFAESTASLYNKAKRENDTIFYNHIPDELPSPPEPKKLATSTEYQMPAPSLEVSEGIANTCRAQDAQKAAAMQYPGSAGGQPGTSHAEGNLIIATQPGQTAGSHQTTDAHTEGSSDTACWRWLLVIIALPLLAIVSVIGIIVWIVLLPLKCCCCPVGMLAQLIWDVFEWLIKAPLRGLLWASGKPWKPAKASSAEKQRSEKTDSPV